MTVAGTNRAATSGRHVVSRVVSRVARAALRAADATPRASEAASRAPRAPGPRKRQPASRVRRAARHRAATPHVPAMRRAAKAVSGSGLATESGPAGADGAVADGDAGTARGQTRPPWPGPTAARRPATPCRRALRRRHRRASPPRGISAARPSRVRRSNHVRRSSRVRRPNPGRSRNRGRHRLRRYSRRRPRRRAPTNTWSGHRRRTPRVPSATTTDGGIPGDRARASASLAGDRREPDVAQAETQRHAHHDRGDREPA